MGKIQVKKKPKLTWNNIKAVFQSLIRSNTGLPSHISEQIIWRRIQISIKEPRCWESGSCIVCGCEILGKSMEDRACSAEEVGDEPCYPKMMNKQEWKEYKFKNQIKYFEDVNCK